MDPVVSLTPAELHLAYLAANAVAAVVTVLGVAGVVLMRTRGERVSRACAVVAVVMVATAQATLAEALRHHGVHWSDAADNVLPLGTVAFATAVSLLLAITLPGARGALLVTTVTHVCALGLAVYAALVVSVPPEVSLQWEASRMAGFVQLFVAGLWGMLGVGLLCRSTRSPSVRGAFVLGTAVGLWAATEGIVRHPDPGAFAALLAWGPPTAFVVLIAALALARHRGGALARVLGTLKWLLTRRASALAALTTCAAAGIAVVAGGAGSMREASRLSLLGTGVTPALLVPFLFAFAVGSLLGRAGDRRSAPWAFVLTIGVPMLLLAQKEIGNTGVVLFVGACSFLVLRGTWMYLLAFGVLGGLGAIVAYRLAPILAFIPFTVQERIQLWLGSADLLQRGGHLVAGRHVTFELGRFWGFGMHRTPGLNLGRSIAALDTDFPLAVLGLFGGAVLLCVFVALLACLAVLLLETVRGLAFASHPLSARWHGAVLTALAVVPVASSYVNVSGAIARTTPFTGVPVAFVSYSVTFLLGAFAVVCYAMLLGEGTALRQRLKLEAERARWGARARTTSWAELVGRTGATGPRAERRSTSFVTRVDLPASPIRFRRIDAGAVALMAGSVAVAVVLASAIVSRYLDPALYHGHPRLQTTLRIEPVIAEAGTRFRVVEGPSPWLGQFLADGERIRVDGLLIERRKARLVVVGACFPEAAFEAGVTLGFSGLLDPPTLSKTVETTVDRALARADLGYNHIVLPFGDIALRHAVVRKAGADYVVERLTPSARLRVLGPGGDVGDGGGPLDIDGGAFVVGIAPPRTLRLAPDGATGDMCLQGRTALGEYTLSLIGPTVIGPMSVRRHQAGARSVDLAFAERVKRACELGILTADGPDGPLSLLPHAPEDRRQWSREQEDGFFGVFTLTWDRRGGQTVSWRRPFYSDGSRVFDGRRETSAFLIDGTDVLGLADSFRFRHQLGAGRIGLDVSRLGRLLDRHGTALTSVDPVGSTITPDVPGTGALLGFALERSAVRDGLLRVFGPVLQGLDVPPDPRRELEALLSDEFVGPWGHDVVLTLDADIQALVFEVIDAESSKLDAADPDSVHHASIVVLGHGNELLAAAQVPDVGRVTTLVAAEELARARRVRPMHAPSLDAFHRRTTLGSTIKVLTAMAAMREPEGALIGGADAMWYIDAANEPTYARDGRFSDVGGVLRSHRGVPITPIRNFGHKSFGRVVSLSEMLFASINTAAAYLGLNVGRERFLELLDLIGARQPLDLIPVALSRLAPYDVLLARATGLDAARGVAASVGAIPSSERWTASYTARLPLSGTSDYSALTLAAAASPIAYDGLYHPPTIVRELVDRRTRARVRLPRDVPIRVLSPAGATHLREYLQETVRKGTAGSLRRRLPRGEWSRIAAKTGTGETVVPVDPNVGYSRARKPKTRDNKVLLAMWPVPSRHPYVIVAVYEQISHLDSQVAIRSVANIVARIAELEARRNGAAQ